MYWIQTRISWIIRGLILMNFHCWYRIYSKWDHWSSTILKLIHLSSHLLYILWWSKWIPASNIPINATISIKVFLSCSNTHPTKFSFDKIFTVNNLILNIYKAKAWSYKVDQEKYFNNNNIYFAIYSYNETLVKIRVFFG